MKEKVNILGVGFNNLTEDETVEKILGFLGSKKNHTVFTVNPEIVVEANKNSSFKSILNASDLVTADGIGVVLASRIIKKPLKMRVAGYDLVQALFEHIQYTGDTVYFFGGKPGVADLAAKKMKTTYPGLQIVGSHHGYVTSEEAMAQAIQASGADLVLVGLGAPKQEAFIAKYKDHMGGSVYMGVGGSFDVMSGQVKRAPSFFIRWHLEWFYRLIKNPSRFKRMLRLPLFLWQVICFGKKYQ